MIIALILVAGLIWLLMVLFGKKDAGIPSASETISPETSSLEESLNPPTLTPFPESGEVKAPAVGDDRVEIERVSIIFAQQYGSYSNQSDFAGFGAIKTLSSNKMNAWLGTYLEKIRQQYKDKALYEGVTTQVLSLTIDDFSSDESKVSVKTRRFFSKSGEVTPKEVFQDIQLSLIKFQNHWLADGAFWK